MTPEQMKLAVEQDKQERAQACMAAVLAVLKEHRCELVGTPVIQEGRIVAQVQLVAV
tara:strand:- start:775 stop:945 length:171 start_codon:yes stop_codon:yes gene_type:complete